MTAKVKTTAEAEAVLEEDFPEETDTEETGETKALDVTAKVKTTAEVELVVKIFQRKQTPSRKRWFM